MLALVLVAAGVAAIVVVRLTLSGPEPPMEGPVVARVEARPDTTRIGRPVNLVFEVRTPAEARVAFAPQPTDDSLWTWQRWELGRTARSSEGVHHRLEAVALPFRTGELIVPTPAYTVTREDGEAVLGAFPKLTVSVQSVLPAEDPTPDIRGLKPPLTVPWWMRMPWWVIGLALVLMAAGLWLWKRWPRKKTRDAVRAVAAEPAEPAHLEALAALDRLADEKLPQRGLWYEHQGRLSEIARRFLERRFGSPRESLTTRELCLHLVWRGLPGAEIERLRTLLRVADLAKFARTDPGVERLEKMAEEARALVLAWAEPEASETEAQAEAVAEPQPRWETRE
jgi:hypothetical protein